MPSHTSTALHYFCCHFVLMIEIRLCYLSSYMPNNFCASLLLIEDGENDAPLCITSSTGFSLWCLSQCKHSQGNLVKIFYSQGTDWAG